jgi:hypothetical protein
MKTKKMALGGGANVQQRLTQDPAYARQQANQAAYTGVQQGRKQFAIGSPEAQNYRDFMAMEENKYRSIMRPTRSLETLQRLPMGTYTPATYNPNTAYSPLLAQQRDAFKTKAAEYETALNKAQFAQRMAAKGITDYKMPDFARPVRDNKPGPKMAKGGMASSASKRGDGIVSKGKTKCKMY